MRKPAFREELLSDDLMFEVTPAGVHVVTVYVRDLPVELPEARFTPSVMAISRTSLTYGMETVSF